MPVRYDLRGAWTMAISDELAAAGCQFDPSTSSWHTTCLVTYERFARRPEAQVPDHQVCTLTVHADASIKYDVSRWAWHATHGNRTVTGVWMGRGSCTNEAEAKGLLYGLCAGLRLCAQARERMRLGVVFLRSDNQSIINVIQNRTGKGAAAARLVSALCAHYGFRAHARWVKGHKTGKLQRRHQINHRVDAACTMRGWSRHKVLSQLALYEDRLFDPSCAAR